MRAVMLGLALTPVNLLFLVKMLWEWGGFTGDESLFHNTVAVLFLLGAYNQIAKRFRPRLALHPGEILTIYFVLALGTGLVCSVWDLGGALAGTITYPFWFDSNENRWQELLWPNLPTWLTVQDPEVLEGFFVGQTDPYQPAILRAWVTPALWWASLVGALMWVCLCLNSLVRRRWDDEEKLPFPMTTLPVQAVDDSYGLWRSKLWWAGVVFSLGLGLWNTTTRVWPMLPTIPTSFDYSAYLRSQHPWDLIPYQAIGWSPWYLGLCYLMPLDLAFSLFAFNLLWVSEYLVAGHFGWCTNPFGGFPYGQDQTAGGFLAIVVSFIWLDRRYFAQVTRKVLGMRSSLRGHAQEAFGYRGAVLGAVLGSCYLWWLLSRAGMHSYVAIGFLALYFAVAMALSRIRAQLGSPTHSVELAMPNFMLRNLLGTAVLGPRALGVFALMKPYLLEQRNSPVPLQLEALKSAEHGRMARRRLAILLAVAAPLAVICYFWASVHVGYQMGVATGYTHDNMSTIPRWLTEELAADLQGPGGPARSPGLAMGFGMICTVALMFLRLSLSWWPLHPVAFPIALSATVQAMTVAILVTWLVKALLLHYGGLRAHRIALPLFLGFIAGDATGYTMQRVVMLLTGTRV